MSFIPCHTCGGAGRYWESAHGGNDPDVWDVGSCPTCVGSGNEPCDNCGDDAAFNAQLARRNRVPKTPLPHGASAYTVRVERMDYAGRKQHIEFDGYALLRELMDDIEAEADKRGWFEDTAS